MKKRKSRFSDEDVKRFSIGLPESLLRNVEALAKSEMKSVSLMCWKLIEEAVKTREEKKRDAAGGGAGGDGPKEERQPGGKQAERGHLHAPPVGQ